MVLVGDISHQPPMEWNLFHILPEKRTHINAFFHSISWHFMAFGFGLGLFEILRNETPEMSCSLKANSSSISG